MNTQNNNISHPFLLSLAPNDLHLWKNEQDLRKRLIETQDSNLNHYDIMIQFHNSLYHEKDVYQSSNNYYQIPCLGQLPNNLHFDDFVERFHISTNFIFSKLDWQDIIIAGGSVLDILRSQPITTDVDFFITTTNHERASKAVERILNCVESRFPNNLFIRNINSITTHCDFNPISQKKFNVQVVLRFHKCITHVITSFNIDSCTVAYNGHHLHCMPRFIRAITLKYNLIDPSDAKNDYPYRLHKYRYRGFGIAIPGYQGQNSKNTNIGNYKGLYKILYFIRCYEQQILKPSQLSLEMQVVKEIRDQAVRHIVQNDIKCSREEFIDIVKNPSEYVLKHNILLKLRTAKSVKGILNAEDKTVVQFNSSLSKDVAFSQYPSKIMPLHEDWYNNEE